MCQNVDNAIILNEVIVHLGFDTFSFSFLSKFLYYFSSPFIFVSIIHL